MRVTQQDSLGRAAPHLRDDGRVAERHGPTGRRPPGGHSVARGGAGLPPCLQPTAAQEGRTDRPLEPGRGDQGLSPQTPLSGATQGVLEGMDGGSGPRAPCRVTHSVRATVRPGWRAPQTGNPWKPGETSGAGAALGHQGACRGERGRGGGRHRGPGPSPSLTPTTLALPSALGPRPQMDPALRVGPLRRLWWTDATLIPLPATLLASGPGSSAAPLRAQQGQVSEAAGEPRAASWPHLSHEPGRAVGARIPGSRPSAPRPGGSSLQGDKLSSSPAATTQPGTTNG